MILPEADIWQRLKDTERPLILYGTGNGADKILNELERLGISVKGIMASDDFVRGQTFRGFTVRRLSDLETEFPDPVILIAFGSQRPEVMDGILSLARKHTVLCPDVPVYGEEIFNSGFLARHIHEIERAYSLWEDDESRRVYENIVCFKLTGELSCLTRCFSSKERAFREILRPDENEVFLDLGAYRGDTIEELLSYTNGRYRYIVALEPDKKTFRKLKQNTEDLENVRLFNMGIWDENTDLNFEGSLGRGSWISDRGKGILPVTTIDTLFSKRRVTFVKIDVEGAEEKALMGGASVIGRDRPKINMALYHRSSDIFRLPLLLHEICPEYKMYLRQHPHIPAWDCNLYAV